MITPQYTISTMRASNPVSYAEMATHLRLLDDTERVYVDGLIDVATEYCERITGRATTQATWKMVAQAWHTMADCQTVSGCRCIKSFPIYRTPLISLTSVKYYAPDANSLTTVTNTEYSAVTGTEPGRIYFPNTLPEVDTDRPDAIQIIFVAGVTHACNVPPIMRHAIKLMVAHMYEIRVPVNIGNIVNEIPLTLTDLLRNQRIGGQFS